jgi:hypothetical protein
MKIHRNCVALVAKFHSLSWSSSLVGCLSMCWRDPRLCVRALACSFMYVHCVNECVRAHACLHVYTCFFGSCLHERNYYTCDVAINDKAHVLFFHAHAYTGSRNALHIILSVGGMYVAHTAHVYCFAALFSHFFSRMVLTHMHSTKP